MVYVCEGVVFFAVHVSSPKFLGVDSRLVVADIFYEYNLLGKAVCVYNICDSMLQLK